MSYELYRYALPLRQALRCPGYELHVREGLLINIDGQWGEIAPLPGFSTETLAEAYTDTLACVTALAAGQSPVPRYPSVQWGLDCARTPWPASTAACLAPYPLLMEPPDRLWAKWPSLLARWGDVTTGLPRLKLKVGRYGLRAELALVRFLCDRLPQTRFILDANGGWTRHEAFSFCAQLDLSRIHYLEDPCPTWEDMRWLAAHLPIRLAADELWRNAPQRDFFQGLVALVIKPMLLGSLAELTALITQAKAQGIECVISSSFESALGLERLAQYAAWQTPQTAPGLDTLDYFTHSVFNAEGQLNSRTVTLVHAWP